MATNFGWWYPPGAANDPNAPYNQTGDEPCDVCGQPVDNCVCPECPVCGLQGAVSCYAGDEAQWPDHHGLVRSPAQVAAKAEADARWEAQAEDEYLERRNHYDRIADHIDGYDRDDLGESPDY